MSVCKSVRTHTCALPHGLGLRPPGVVEEVRGGGGGAWDQGRGTGAVGAGVAHLRKEWTRSARHRHDAHLRTKGGSMLPGDGWTQTRPAPLLRPLPFPPTPPAPLPRALVLVRWVSSAGRQTDRAVRGGGGRGGGDGAECMRAPVSFSVSVEEDGPGFPGSQHTHLASLGGASG